MIDAPGGGRASGRSARKEEGGESPGSRVCKTLRLGRLRSFFAPGPENEDNASTGGVGPSSRALKGSKSDADFEATDRFTEMPGVGRSATAAAGWPSSSNRTARSFLQQAGAKASARDAQHDDAHPVPDVIVNYVRLLRGCPLRSFFIVLWLTLAVSGASIYFPLSRILKISVEPPFGSESEAAKLTYAENFPPEPVTLVALLSANVRDSTGAHSNASLINSAAQMFATPWPPFFGYDPAGALTAEAEAISIDLKRMVKPHLKRCEFNFYSFFDMPFEVQMVAHEFLFPSRWGGREGMIAVHLVSCDGHAIYKECVYKHEPFCEPVEQLLADWASYRDQRNDKRVALTFCSYPVIFEDIIMGIEWGMALSTVATMLAFMVLAVMLRNIRQLVLVSANIMCSIGTTLLIMYPVSYFVMDVNVCAPAMLVAVALAMSIDYSLFLLTRFNEERATGRTITQALEIAITTQGHTIIISGATLALCFTSMLMLPTSTITSMAAGAATAVLQSVLTSLSLTPSLLLSFPMFFTCNRRFGLTLDGTPFAGPARVSINAPAPPPAVAGAPRVFSAWARLGRASQMSAPCFALLLAVAAVPFAIALTKFTYVEDLTPLMQTTHPATHAFIKLGNTFGQDLSTPVFLLVLAPSKEAMASREWSLATCHMLQNMALDVTAEMSRQGYEYEMHPADFNGLMIFTGNCLADGLHWGIIDVMPAIHMSGAYDMVADLLSNREQTATQVVVHCRVDLFSAMGEAWMRAVRKSLPRPPVLRQPLGGGHSDPNEFAPYGVWNGVQIGALHLYGEALVQVGSTRPPRKHPTNHTTHLATGAACRSSRRGPAPPPDHTQHSWLSRSSPPPTPHSPLTTPAFPYRSPCRASDGRRAVHAAPHAVRRARHRRHRLRDSRRILWLRSRADPSSALHWLDACRHLRLGGARASTPFPLAFPPHPSPRPPPTPFLHALGNIPNTSSGMWRLCAKASPRQHDPQHQGPQPPQPQPQTPR